MEGTPGREPRVGSGAAPTCRLPLEKMLPSLGLGSPSVDRMDKGEQD